ncbi:T9SS type A sorting domain-containing protein [bacterium]|nr:T9SS type A sorting domain-containing protein [bacterium]
MRATFPFQRAAVSIMFCFGFFAHAKNDVWQVQRAAFPPVIDGKMDELYKTASSERLVKLNEDDSALPDNYSDLFAQARLLWDEDNLYAFVKVVDDEISTDSENPYENDSVEIMVDGNNSKVFQGRDQDDTLIRIEYQDAMVTAVDNAPEGMAFAVADCQYPAGASGYAVEAAFPLNSLNIGGEAGTIFGLEIQVNDRDSRVRENVIRWWGASDDAWFWAHLWGEAELTDYMADTVLTILGNYRGAPVIDGILDELWKDTAPEIDQGTYVFLNNGIGWNGYKELDLWDDAQMSYRAMVYADAFYFWCEVIDDEISTSGDDPGENDGIVLYFDGDNSKNNFSMGVPYDENDQRFNWVYGTEEPGITNGNEVLAWSEPDSLSGYSFELMIPMSDLAFYPLYDIKIGFEVQVNDRDHEILEHIIRWWGNDLMSCLDASRFGTALLLPVPPPPPSPAFTAYNNIGPHGFVLFQNCPNPFNYLTTISYSLPEISQVRFTVLNIHGDEVAVMNEGVKPPGSYNIRFDASQLSSGVYVCQMETRCGVVTQKMMLMK